MRRDFVMCEFRSDHAVANFAANLIRGAGQPQNAELTGLSESGPSKTQAKASFLRCDLFESRRFVVIVLPHGGELPAHERP